MVSKISILVIIGFFGLSHAISLEDQYHNNLVKKSIDSVNANALDYKHIADVDGEKILPRSYAVGGDLFFDENGASYPVNPTSFSLGDLLQGSNVAGNQRISPGSYY